MVIVFVDDSETNLKTYTLLAGRIANATSKGFSNPASALGWCAEHEPDLIVLDYRMPEIDGFEFLRRLRATPGRTDTAVIMLTAERDRDTRLRALELGASEFLSKPADPVEFLTRVRNMLTIRERDCRLKRHAQSLADDVQRATKEIVDREHETIVRLMRATEFRDNDTGMHVLRMGQYAMTIARAMELPREEQELLRLAAPMHDIGKVATPDHILLKPGKLDPDEWQIMQQHASAGYEILADSKSVVLQRAARIALSHHERWDGSGYPQKLLAREIPLEARIAAVGDVFDALISKRPYKKAWGFEEALVAVHRSSGSHFDPDVVRAFEASIPEIRAILGTFSDPPCGRELA